MNRIVRGAIAGIVATVLMSIPIFTAQRLGLFNQPPPIAISKNVAKKTSLLPDSRSSGFSVVWLLAHLAYGATGGALYGLVRSRLTGSWPTAGIIFGGAVWGGSYAGYLPALDLYPSPEEDRDARVATMMVAHAVYGLAIAYIVERTEHAPGNELNIPEPTWSS